ncbi:MAG: hypothetical protein FWE46_04255 [Coriobacteriia bacterium]|nr:hypothetical protein [Coriobacteriia bacterium]MCL2537182.1 hypothetical protein [Coriobacteriia bacterium]
MGGRGSSSGISNSGMPYGSEYEPLLLHQNMLFVRERAERGRTPAETRSGINNRIYVTIDTNMNEVKAVTYYDKAGIKNVQIDLRHFHKGMKPHAHDGYNHGEPRRLTITEVRNLNKALKIWEKNKGL